MDETPVSGPDFRQGIDLSEISDGGMLVGHVEDEAVLLVRSGDEVFAICATCTHWSAPLADGLLAGDTIRCPWHHARFSLRTGQPLRPPAMNALSRWRVERLANKIYVREKLGEVTAPKLPLEASTPKSIVIIGGGAAGNMAAETLRHEGYAGRITMLTADDCEPCDRPNLSKAYLAGTAPEEWIPLRPPEFYAEKQIELKKGTRVDGLDSKARNVVLADGSRIGYDALLLATGADPIRLQIPGVDLSHVHYLRTLADSKALIAKAETSKQVVIVGASFIGLEVAAALRARNIEVHVVGMESVPMELILGAQVGNFIRALHESHGVVFHLENTVTSIDAHSVRLKSGEQLQAELVVLGVGVRPAVALAEKAGLTLDRGVAVNEYLETSAPGVFAAGDIARWPDPLTSERIRVEHWVVAERQGQTAARNMLGRRERFDAVPFFWTDQYDFSLAYVGHAEKWDKVEIDGKLDLDHRNCTITYWNGGKKQAVATVQRDHEALMAELELEERIVKS